MNLKGLLTVILKLLAIYIIIRSIAIIPSLLNSIGYLSHTDSIFIGFVNLFLVLLTITVYLLIAWLLIVKTDWVVTNIVRDDRLEADFTTFKIHRSIVLTITIIVIGGLTIIEEMPMIVKFIYKATFQSDYPTSREYDNLFVSFVRILIGVYLVYFNKLIVNWIEKKRKEG